MKKLIITAMAAVAMLTSSAMADYELLNPQKGAICNVYNKRVLDGALTPSKLISSAALNTIADLTPDFTQDPAKGLSAGFIIWEGYINVKKTGTYTFVGNNRNNFYCYMYLEVNDEPLFKWSTPQAAGDIALRVGWNKVRFTCAISASSVGWTLTYKPKGSVATPKKITPASLFYELPDDDF